MSPQRLARDSSGIRHKTYSLRGRRTGHKCQCGGFLYDTAHVMNFSALRRTRAGRGVEGGRAAKPYLLNPASGESLPADAGEHPEKGIKDVTAKITESC